MATDEEQRPSKRLRLEDDDTSSRDDDHEQMQGYHSTAKGSRRQSNSASPDPKLDDASEAPPRDAEHLDGNDSRRSEEERDKSVAASLKEGTPTEEKAEDANPKPAARIGQARVQYKQRLILRGHRKGVACVRFSPDGNWIASCCQSYNPCCPLFLATQITDARPAWTYISCRRDHQNLGQRFRKIFADPRRTSGGHFDGCMESGFEDTGLRFR